mgnify:FL=1|jgi:glutamine synthetase type III|tara:strand:+ start:256 stop:651 length:396 start_codon:yes stop_codon:yes gene_type:complete
MNIAAAHQEDDIVEKLKKENADLQRKVTLLEKHKKLTEQEINNRKRITVDQFCARNNLSKVMYYELAKEGLAPKSYKLCNDKGEPVIKRSFINISDEEAWQKDPKRWQQYDYDMSHTKVDEHGNPRKPLTV